jgi:hypothetical protein
MNWQWVVLILGLVLNLVIIMIAMSEGCQWYLGTRHKRAAELGGTDTEFKNEVPKHETQRRL